MMIEFADQLEDDAVIVEEVGTEMKALSYFKYREDGGMLKIGRTEGRALAAVLMPVLPPTELSTWASNVVGT